MGLLSLHIALSTLSPFATPLIVGAAVAGHGPLPTLSTLIVALYQSLARPAAHDPSSTLRMLRRSLSRVSTTLNSTEHHPSYSSTRTIGAYFNITSSQHHRDARRSRRPSCHHTDAPLQAAVALFLDRFPSTKRMLYAPFPLRENAPPVKHCLTNTGCALLHAAGLVLKNRRPNVTCGLTQGLARYKPATIAIYGNRFNRQSSPGVP